MISTTKNDEAVSPVIGVILMVAITVILAAVIAAFVFGMTGNVSKTKSMAATVQQIGNNIIVTYQGGQDNGAFDTAGTLQAKSDVASAGTLVDFGTFSVPPAVGESVSVAKIDFARKAHVVVVANFADGTSQLIMDTQV